MAGQLTLDRRFIVIPVVAVLTLLLIGAWACNDDSRATGGDADVSFTLRTSSGHEGLAFVGVGGDIDGVHNPDLQVAAGDSVEVTLVNGDGAEHNISFPDFEVTSPNVAQREARTTVSFEVTEDGDFEYFCTLAGHRQAGMEGKVVVGGGAAEPATGADIVREPTDLPPPIGERAPETVRVSLEAVEVEGQLAEDTTYTYWTFDSKVPGPFLRVRQGDTVEVTLKNSADNLNTHSIDLHAVTGPGGGAAVTSVAPGEEKTFTFKALKTGAYVYHCATPSVANHISSGMFGLIVVEPEGGLPPVDHEFYVGQGEIYTAGAFGDVGHQEFDHEKMLDEQPEYFVVNGAVGSLTEQHPLEVEVGDSVRIYYGVGGPNFTSSFHVIGEIFDRVYNQASLASEPLLDVQTTTVAPGGATVVEFTVEVPGTYILVDHALARLERGLAGYLIAEGADNPDVFHEGAAE
ncbi:MAG: copper-containing nitrite reductase [Dehalococcoidia bacterium]